MRLAFTSDLHVEYQMDVVAALCERLAQHAPDALLLAGDVCPDLARLEAALRLLVAACPGPVLMLPGNHELWCGGVDATGPDSRERYLVTLPARVRRAGAVPLGVEPHVLGDTAFVGVTGWYDYSLRDPSLDDTVAIADYRAKQLGELICVDGQQVVWPAVGDALRSDEELTAFMTELLIRQLEDAAERARQIVVATHVLPDHHLLARAHRDRRVEDTERRFLDAFMGSDRLGDAIRQYPKVVRVIAGHLHQPARWSSISQGLEIIWEVSPVGYPREASLPLPEQLDERLRIVEI